MEPFSKLNSPFPYNSFQLDLFVWINHLQLSSSLSYSVTSGTLKQSFSALNGSMRNVVSGLFSCSSRNRVTKLSCRCSTSASYLALCLFRMALMTCPLAFSRVGKCVNSPFSKCTLNSFSLLINANTLCTRSDSILNLPCRVRFKSVQVAQYVDQKAQVHNPLKI